MNTRQERYQLGCLLTWSLLVTQTQGKKIVLQVKSCSSPNESEFVALPVFPAYPYYLTGVKTLACTLVECQFSTFHLAFSISLTNFNSKKLQKKCFFSSWEQHSRKLSDTYEGCFEKQLGKRNPEESYQKMAICERKACFFNLHFPMIFDLPIYIYLFEFKKEGVLPILKN